MILIDTNVIIDALDSGSRYHEWARGQIADAVSGEGGAINAVILAELCAGKKDVEEVEKELKKAGVQVFDLPSASASICGKAYRKYKTTRLASGSAPAPTTPLADFFIGAHAEVMQWKVATRDRQRFETYFPKVELLT